MTDSVGVISIPNFLTSFKISCDVKSKNALRSAIGTLSESVPQLMITIILQVLQICGESKLF